MQIMILPYFITSLLLLFIGDSLNEELVFCLVYLCNIGKEIILAFSYVIFIVNK